MDILKKAYNNIHQCRMNTDTVEVCGKSYPQSIKIDFPTPKSKEYTLGSVIFYLMNSSIALTEYVEKCQKEGVAPVSYLDHAPIREDINNYVESRVPGFFVYPVYTYNRKYTIPDIRDFYFILVPNDVLGPINVENIAGLLNLGILMKEVTEPFTQKSKDVEIENIRFKVLNNVESLTGDDWDGVRAVFLNDKDYLLESLGDNFAKLSKNSAIFSTSARPFKCTRLIFDDKRHLKNHKEVIEAIKQKIFMPDR